jgi:hypothetical protein
MVLETWMPLLRLNISWIVLRTTIFVIWKLYGDECCSHDKVYDDLLIQISLSHIITGLCSLGDGVGVVVDRNLIQTSIKVYVTIPLRLYRSFKWYHQEVIFTWRNWLKVRMRACKKYKIGIRNTKLIVGMRSGMGHVHSHIDIIMQLRRRSIRVTD